MTAVDAPPRPPRAPGPKPPRDGRWHVVAALARVEARRLLRHPLTWGSLVLGALPVVLLLVDLRLVLPRESVVVHTVALIAGAGALVAVHLATTRPRRDGVTEVLAPAVRGEDCRTLALLLAALAPAAVTATAVALGLAVAAALGAVGPVVWAQVAIAPVLVAGGGVAGVVLGRLAPSRVAAAFALVALAVVQLGLSEVGGPGRSTPVELLGPAVIPAGALPEPTALLHPAGLHLLYLIGGVGVLAAGAALLSRRSPRRAGALGLALLVTATAGAAQMRPPDDGEVAALLARVVDPVAAGECTTGATDARVCALPSYEPWRDGWVGLVDAVRAPLIANGVAPGPLTVAQRTLPSAAAYELSRWFDAERVGDGAIPRAWDAAAEPPAGQVLVGTQWPRGTDEVDRGALDLAIHTARQATGLPATAAFVWSGPDRVDEGSLVCSPAGQAREAVTLWLAAQADPSAAGALAAAAAEHPYPGTDADPLDDGSGIADPDHLVSLHSGAVELLAPRWSKPGVHVAQQLAARPVGEVASAIAEDWARWTDPATPLRDLVAALDLTTPPLAADIAAQLAGSAAADLDGSYRDTPLPSPAVDEAGRVVLDAPPDAGLKAFPCA